jgi:hypothetical protein
VYNEIMGFQTERHTMVQSQLVPRGITDPEVLHAMATVPRHSFIPAELWGKAYDDCALPIGEGQTISQPFIVASMAQALELTGTERVLEIGTGSGYAAAVLSLLAGEIYTVERIPELASAGCASSAIGTSMCLWMMEPPGFQPMRPLMRLLSRLQRPGFRSRSGISWPKEGGLSSRWAGGTRRS